MATAEPSTATAEIESLAPMQEEPGSGEGRYAKLAVWLQELSSQLDDAFLTFEEIERIIGAELPPSARSHRAWWANDPVSHPQSKLWLEVNWRVADVDLGIPLVHFSKTRDREAAYIRFFSMVGALLEK